ncbi:hypothetical protein ACTWP4_18760 [Gracilibacillus sp. D59]|uniref:hypothetical protein n=1 Tax=Gracilibacillus sp. D59 TaxID=3457434 RepID=UPI003FCE1397
MEKASKEVRQEEVKERKQYLLTKLQSMGITHYPDGRDLSECSLFTLEYVYIQEKCKRGGVVEWQPTPENEARV